MTFVLYQVLYLWVPYWLAYTAVFVAAFFFTLVANTSFVFHTRISARSTFYFLTVYILNYLAGLAIMSALIEWLHVPGRVSPIGAFGFLVVFNFLGTRLAIGTCR